MISDLTLASVSDVHLGHRKTPTKHIINNLYDAFPDTEETGELDILFIVGDLFDGPLNFYGEDPILAQVWMFDLLKVCAKRDIVVRILEGTRSHDWKQNVWFNVVKAISGLPVDVKWMSELSIEYIERFDINILYVPDEWRPETDQTWLEANQLLKAHNLSQVDFTLLHGAFAEQLPEQADCPKHIAHRYQSITRRKVFAGHIHQRWVNGNILGNGSFDRLCHGDEDIKGHWRVRYRQGNETVRFVENKNAMRYVTVQCSGMETDEALRKIDDLVISLPIGSHIRVQAKTADPIIGAMDLLKKQYKDYSWTISTSDKKASQAKLMVDHRHRVKLVPISPENIRGLLEERLAKRDISPELMQTCRNNLTQLGLT